MKLSLVCLFAIACGAALPCTAQSGSAAVGSASSAAGEPASEPNVKRTVIEDDGARIEELKVRGHTQPTRTGRRFQERCWTHAPLVSQPAAHGRTLSGV